MAYVLRTNNINHEIDECPNQIVLAADNSKTTDLSIKASLEGYIELYSIDGTLPTYTVDVGDCVIESVEVAGWSKSNIKLGSEGCSSSGSGSKIDLQYSAMLSARYSAEPQKVTQENASAVGKSEPKPIDLGTQSSLRFKVELSHYDQYTDKTYSETIEVHLSSVEVKQEPAPIEIDTSMPESSVEVANEGGVTVNEDGSVTITEPSVNTSGTDTSTSKKQLAVKLKQKDANGNCIYDIQLDALFAPLGPIKLPDWLVLNLVALETGWYSQVTFIPAQLIAITNDLVQIAKDLTEYSVKYNLAKLACIELGEANYKRVMNGGDKHIVRLEDYTEYTDYTLSGGKVEPITIRTRTIYGEPWNPALYVAQKEFRSNALKLIKVATDFMTYTSSNFGGIDILGLAGVGELLKFLKFDSSTNKYQLVWDDEKEFEFMKWIYHDAAFNKKLVKALQQLNGEIGLNKVMRGKKVSNYLDYVAEYEYKDENTGWIYSDHLRPLERFTWAATDVIKGSTPFTLASSEIFVNEYFTSSKAIDMINDFIHALVKAKEAIMRIPKDIQDLATSIMEPMGAVVITPLGAGAVATNPLQILGGLTRTKSALSQLKTDIDIPLNLFDSLGVPESFLAPLKIISDLLGSIPGV